MSNIIKKVEQKLGDHPNVSDDPNINPSSGTGPIGPKGEDPNKSWVQNKVEVGLGHGSPDDVPARAGSTTSSDTTSAGSASGAIAGEQRSK